MVGVVVACGAAELGRQRHGLERGQLLLEPVDEHHYFLAKPCGRGGLAVGLGQHGHIFPLIGVLAQLGYELLDERIVHVGQGVLYRQRHAGVVDVLRGEPEVDELLVGVEPANLVELLLDEVFHCLNIVVCHLLYFLDAARIGLREVGIDGAQAAEKAVVESGQLGQRQLAQGDEVFYFDAHPVADERIF